MNTAGADASTLFSDLVWPDFYALLDVPFDASPEQLRARLREVYLEATANADHRHVERRLHYQMMGQRIVPQARRILLEERARRAYNRQLMLHRNNDPAAVPYTRFVTQLAAFEAEEDTVRPLDNAPNTILSSRAPSIPSTILSSVVPAQLAEAQPAEAQPAEMQPVEPQVEVARAASSTRLDLSSTTDATSTTTEANVAHGLFEQAHTVLLSEEKYAEMSSLPSLDSGNEARASIRDNATRDNAKSDNAKQEVAASSQHSAASRDVPRASIAKTSAQNASVQAFAAPSSGAQTRTSPGPSQTSSSLQASFGNSPATGQEISEAPRQDTLPNDLATANKTFDPRRSRRIRGESSTGLEAAGGAQNTGEVPILQRVVAVLPAKVEEPDDLPLEGSLEEDATPGEPVVALLSSRVIKAPEEEPRTEEEAQRARVLRVERGARPLNTEQLRATSGQDLGNGVRGIVSSGRETANANARAPRSRVSVSTEESDEAGTRGQNRTARGQRPHGQRVRGQRVLSQPIMMGLTALASAAAMFLILHLRSENNAGVARTGLRIVYSSDLQPIMEQAQQDFAATAQGRTIALDLQPIDSRDAMHLALGVPAPDGSTTNATASNATASTPNANTTNANATIPDIWIPGETLWSDRFNQVAGKFRQHSISVARSLAVSPLVLIARGDHASVLRKRFPNHTISSWDALRRAVAVDAPNHFGLTDPQRSGSGALVRLFMAREWCERNHVAWNKAATSDARLWKWMAGFEDNVPGNAALTGDMVKELVMGNSDRFWWGVGYESDALGWMKRGKSLEIFYLPRTALAQHPFCLLERAGMTPAVRRARSDFESFLRSRAMQSALLQNGFRPTEIGLNDIPNNPFARADFRAKGLRASGFRIDERINYDMLNALNVQWKSRY